MSFSLLRDSSLTCVLQLAAGQLVDLSADLGLESVDDEVQGLGAAGVHVDEELVLLLVAPRRAGLDVGQVDALLLLVGRRGHKAEKKSVLFSHSYSRVARLC